MTDLALRVAALKILKDYLEACYADARADAARALKPGERLVARSPIDDTKIATVPRSDPKPVAHVVDEQALTAWMLKHYPESVMSGYKVIGSQTEVIRVLFEHAPHLLLRTQAIQLEALHEIKRASAKFGQPIGPGAELDVPGIEIRTPPAVVSCQPVEDAFDIIRDLHDQGVLELDGTIAPALPKGAA